MSMRSKSALLALPATTRGLGDEPRRAQSTVTSVEAWLPTLTSLRQAKRHWEGLELGGFH